MNKLLLLIVFIFFINLNFISSAVSIGDRTESDIQGVEIIQPPNLTIIDQTLELNGTTFLLNNITDVNVPSPSNDEVLTWNTGTLKWIAQAFPATKWIIGLANGFLYNSSSTLFFNASLANDTFWNEGGDDVTGQYNVDGNINITQNITVANRIFLDAEGHYIKLGMEEDTSGSSITSETTSIHHPEGHDEGSVMFAVDNSDDVNMWVIKRINESASGVANSWMAIPDNDLSDPKNMSAIINTVQRWFNYGFTPRLDYDSMQNRTSIAALYGLETQQLHLHNDLGQGVLFVEGSFDSDLAGNDANFFNGSVHPFTPVTFSTGFDLGESRTVLQPQFFGNIAPFTNLDISPEVWISAASPLCDESPCAESSGSPGSVDITMTTNISTLNVNNTQVSFIYSLFNLIGADNFRFETNNHTGSGWEQQFTDAGTETTLRAAVSLDATYWNLSNMGVRFVCDVTQSLRNCYLDSLVVNGTSSIDTVANASGFDTELCGADGSRDANGNCNVGLRWDAASSQWIFAGTLNATGTIIGGVSGSGTINTVSKWISGTGQGNSQITDDGAEIILGLNTIIDGDVNITGRLNVSNVDVGTWLYNQSEPYDNFNYNQTTPANSTIFNTYDVRWSSTFNATYDKFSYNQTEGGDTRFVNVDGDSMVGEYNLLGDLNISGTLNVSGQTLLATSSGNVGIGNIAPTAKLTVGSAIATSSEMLDVRGNAVGQYVASFEQDSSTGWGVLIDTDSSTAGDPALNILSVANTLFLVDSDGNVGIGTDSPGALLHINIDATTGTVPLEVLRLAVNMDDVVNLRAGEGPAIDFYIAENDGGSTEQLGAQIAAIKAENVDADAATELIFSTADNDASLVTAMIIDESQNVGIGTSSVDAAIDVQVQRTDTVDMRFKNTNDGVTDVLGSLQFGNSVDPQIATIRGQASGSTTSGDLVFLTEETGGALEEAMRILADGNVSIGLNDPQAVLEVTGNGNHLGIIRMVQRVSGAAAYGLDMGLDSATGDPVFSRIVNDVVTESFRIQRATGNFIVNNSNLFVNATSGKVGIGTSSPDSKLHLDGVMHITGSGTPTGGIGLELEWDGTQSDILSIDRTGAPANQPMRFRASNFEFFDGNVGIGTSSPEKDLDVEGEIMISAAANNWTVLKENEINLWGRDIDNEALLINNQGYQGGATRFRDTHIKDGKSNTILMVDGSAGNVGIGTSSPVQSLDVRGTAVVSNGSIGLFIGANDPFVDIIGIDPTTGVSFNPIKIRASNNPDFYMDTSGNIGIGTDSPGQTLDVTNTGTTEFPLRVSNNIASAGRWTGIQFGDKPNDVYKAGITFIADGDANQRGDLHFLVDNTADTNDVAATDVKMVITHEGNVGIANTAPTSDLTIGATGFYATNTTRFYLRDNTADKYAAIFDQDHTDGNGVMIRVDGTGADEPALNILVGKPASPLGGTNLFYVGGDGDVGMGTSDPTVDLEVESGGNAAVRIESTGASAFLEIARDATNDDAYIHFLTETTANWLIGTGRTGTESDLSFEYNDGSWNNALFLNGTNGNVGIGTATPNSILDISSATRGKIALRATGVSNTSLVATLGFHNGASVTSQGFVGFGSSIANEMALSNKIVGGDIYLSTVGGNVGVNRTILSAANSALDVLGSIEVSSLTAASATHVCRDGANRLSTCSSSERYKDNILNFSGAGNKFMKLNPITFEWKEEYQYNMTWLNEELINMSYEEKNSYFKEFIPETKHLGFSAEQVREVDERLVSINFNNETESIYYDSLTAWNTQMIQNLKKENDLLKATLCDMGRVEWC